MTFLKNLIVSLVVLVFVSACGGQSGNANANKTTKNTNKTKKNSIPLLVSCDNTNPKVQLIQSVEDWGSINSSEKSIFCISPGDYAKNQKVIEITTSGTKENPRYIVLNNGNNLHPVKQPRETLAKYRLHFKGANYWRVDRQSEWENTKTTSFIKLENSSNNVFTRGLLQDTANGIAIFDKSNNNTIESHHIEKTQWSVDNKVFNDLAAIGLNGWKDGDTIKNTKLEGNEIINYVDGVQLVRHYGGFDKNAKINFEGTRIENNLMYVTNIMYSDGNGNSNPDGLFSFSENAIDLKGGSLNPNNPVVISNNYMWGYKESDRTGTKLDDPGSAIVTHYAVPNVVIENNEISLSDYGIISDGPMQGRSPFSDTKISQNKFYNIKREALISEGDKDRQSSGIKHIKITDNVFFNCGDGVAIKLYYTEGVTIKNNVFSGTGGTFYIPGSERPNKASVNLEIIDNKFYGSSPSIGDEIEKSNNEIIHSVYKDIGSLNYNTGIFFNEENNHVASSLLKGTNLPGGEFQYAIQFPSPEEMDYFVEKGMTIFRVPFRWEYLQPTAKGDFDKAYLNAINAFIEHASDANKGIKIILDMHDYACFQRYENECINNSQLKDTDESRENFADAWGRLADIYGDKDNVIFGLMNEPHHIHSTKTWLKAANAAIAAIRSKGASNLILVPGNHWSGAHSWTTEPDGEGNTNAEVMYDDNLNKTNIIDSNNNYAIEVHQYLDQKGSGGYSSKEDCLGKNAGSQLNKFTDWLVKTNQKGFLGEVGIPNDNKACETALRTMLDHIESNKESWVGWTYWASTKLWTNGDGKHALVLEPDDKDSQMMVLSEFLKQKSPPSLGVDVVSSISGPKVIKSGQKITVNIGYKTTDKDLVFTLQQQHSPWFNYNRTVIPSGSDGSKIVLTVPKGIPVGTALIYQAFLTPKGKGWDQRVAVEAQTGVSVKTDPPITKDVISSISGPKVIEAGQKITIDVAYETANKDLVLSLQQEKSPWRNYVVKTIDSRKHNSKIILTVPSNIPDNTQLMYQAYLTPKGKGWDQRVATRGLGGVSIKVIDDGGHKGKPWEHGKLMVNGRMLQHADGTGFFWMADTAWLLSRKLKENDVTQYLDDRKNKGFNVIQMVVAQSGSREKNAYGMSAFINNNFARPNPKYWEYIDTIISLAEKRGLYIGLLPTWNKGITRTYDAEIYGRFLANRYKDRKNIIWINGGDSNPDNLKHTPKVIWSTLGRAIDKADGNRHLITYHPGGGTSSTQWFNDASWLDFHMIQSGHGGTLISANKNFNIFRASTNKPIIDGEPRYEGILKDVFSDKNDGHTAYEAYDVRAIAYMQVFSGALGHTYGNHAVWQLFTTTNFCCGPVKKKWNEALNDPGAVQMGYLAKLMKSRPILGRVPDNSLIQSGDGAIATKGRGYAMVYLPTGGSVTVNLDKVAGSVKAWWYYPETGAATTIGTFNGSHTFEATSDDMVLVLDDVKKEFSKPGK